MLAIYSLVLVNEQLSCWNYEYIDIENVVVLTVEMCNSAHFYLSNSVSTCFVREIECGEAGVQRIVT